MPEHQLTKCELEVMEVVWDLGTATVQDVVDRLDRALAYTTVMTTLKILEEKNRVARLRKNGRAYVYEPTVTREDVCRSMTTDLTERLFGGSVASHVLSLIDGRSMTRSDIEHLKRAIRELEEGA